MTATLMVVDDDPVTRVFLEEMLRQEGHRVVLAANGQEALDHLDDHDYDLILMDIQMPVLDGYQTTQRIKARMTAGGLVPVVFLTSVQTDRELARCLECGGDDFINKPPSPTILRARIQSWLQRAELSRQLERSYLDLKIANQGLVALNVKLIEAEQIKHDVDQIVRHDLKTPLNSIIGFSDLLWHEDGLSVAYKDKIKVIHDAGVNVLHMVNLSLGLYQMERGDYVCKPEEVDLLAIVRSIQVNLTALLCANGLSFCIRLDAREATESDRFCVQAESVLCYSMLSNLIKNAVEATPFGQGVTVTLIRTDPVACVVIHNPGVVPEAIRATFFEKYATCGKAGGTGLGTYSARLIARTLGGDVCMRTSEATGTDVVVTFAGGESAGVWEAVSRIGSPDSRPSEGASVVLEERFVAIATRQVERLRAALIDQDVRAVCTALERLRQAAAREEAGRVVTQTIRLKGVVELGEWEAAQSVWEGLARTVQQAIQSLDS
ncbi:MAG: response regulator [Magnetococcales bacterium]|nr:response regulator [Magnetococcales bacterium]